MTELLQELLLAADTVILAAEFGSDLLNAEARTGDHACAVATIQYQERTELATQVLALQSCHASSALVMTSALILTFYDFCRSEPCARGTGHGGEGAISGVPARQRPPLPILRPSSVRTSPMVRVAAE